MKHYVVSFWKCKTLIHLSPKISYVVLFIILFMTRISAEPGEIACTRLLQTMFTICFVSSQFKQYAAMLGHGHHRVSLGEGRREHDGADKTLIASPCDMKTFIK